MGRTQTLRELILIDDAESQSELDYNPPSMEDLFQDMDMDSADTHIQGYTHPVYPQIRICDTQIHDHFHFDEQSGSVFPPVSATPVICGCWICGYLQKHTPIDTQVWNYVQFDKQSISSLISKQGSGFPPVSTTPAVT